MFNIAKLHVDVLNHNLFNVTVNSYDDYVTVTKKMKLNDPHPMFINNYLCSLLAYKDPKETGAILIDFKLDATEFLKRTVLTISPHPTIENNMVIFVHNQEILEILNIVDILGELNTYFSVLNKIVTATD